MAKYDVTQALADTIRTARLQNNISSKSVANHIGKSPSYLSKLEKGEIKTISEETLTQILSFIFGKSDNLPDFLNTSLGDILDTLVLRYTDDEINQQIWFSNYDTVMRRIPIPEELVNELNDKLTKLNITLEHLCSRINDNEDISPIIKDLDFYSFNEWHAYVKDHRIEFSFIKMKLNPEDIKAIFDKKITVTNYVTMLAITYYIIKIEQKGTIVQISDDEQKLLMKEAESLLSSFKFYSILERSRLSRQVNSISERIELLNTFDQDNYSLINDILHVFQILSDMDIVKTNKYLEEFYKNLKWDAGFTLKLISSPFYELDNISFTNKKTILNEIKKMEDTYKTMPEEKKTIESYDS